MPISKLCPTIRSDLVYYVRHSAFKAASASAAAARNVSAGTRLGDGAGVGSSSTVGVMRLSA
jgi:hypothetical protein